MLRMLRQTGMKTPETTPSLSLFAATSSSMAAVVGSRISELLMVTAEQPPQSNQADSRLNPERPRRGCIVSTTARHSVFRGQEQIGTPPQQASRRFCVSTGS